MKRTDLALVTVALVGLSGCATQGYVRSQTDPLVERACKLEANEAQLTTMREADNTAIKQANDKAQQALDLANKTAVDVITANNDVKKAEAAAMRAEAAAIRAEKAANEAIQAANEAREMSLKSEKVFKLGQKK